MLLCVRRKYFQYQYKLGSKAAGCCFACCVSFSTAVLQPHCRAPMQCQHQLGSYSKAAGFTFAV